MSSHPLSHEPLLHVTLFGFFFSGMSSQLVQTEIDFNCNTLIVMAIEDSQPPFLVLSQGTLCNGFHMKKNTTSLSVHKFNSHCALAIFTITTYCMGNTPMKFKLPQWTRVSFIHCMCPPTFHFNRCLPSPEHTSITLLRLYLYQIL